MSTSRILGVINSVIGQAAQIPWDWNGLQAGSLPNALLQNVAMWNNQVKTAEKGKTFPFATPALFIELPPQEWQPLPSGFGMCDLTVRLHLVDRQLDTAGQLDGTGEFDQNLEVYTYRDLVKSNFVLFQPPYCSNLFATHEHQDYDHDSLFHYVLDLKCAFADTKGSTYDPDQTKVINIAPVPIEIDASYEDGTPVVVTIYRWQDCLISVILIDAIPPNAPTQQLANGAVIPIYYVLNGDGTLTIPYLAAPAPPSILTIENILTPFLMNNDPYAMSTDVADGVRYATANGATLPPGTFDFSYFGGFATGQNIQFNASCPITVSP